MPVQSVKLQIGFLWFYFF